MFLVLNPKILNSFNTFLCMNIVFFFWYCSESRELSVIINCFNIYTVFRKSRSTTFFKWKFLSLNHKALLPKNLRSRYFPPYPCLPRIFYNQIYPEVCRNNSEFFHKFFISRNPYTCQFILRVTNYININFSVSCFISMENKRTVNCAVTIVKSGVVFKISDTFKVIKKAVCLFVIYYPILKISGIWSTYYILVFLFFT